MSGKIVVVAFVVVVAALMTLLIYPWDKGEGSGTNLKQLLDEGALIVDVRTVGEFSMGFYPGAVNIPDTDIETRLAELGEDKAKPIVLYCRSGRRAGDVKKLLEEKGFTNVHNAGGLKNMTIYPKGE